MLRVSSRVAWQIVGGEALLLELDSGKAVGLNDVGTYLWPRLTRETESDLVKGVVQTFDVDADTARRDLVAFVATLRENGWILDAP